MTYVMTARSNQRSCRQVPCPGLTSIPADQRRAAVAAAAQANTAAGWEKYAVVPALPAR